MSWDAWVVAGVVAVSVGFVLRMLIRRLRGREKCSHCDKRNSCHTKD